VNWLFLALILGAVAVAVGSSLKKAHDLERVKGRPATFGDFHEPAVYHRAFEAGDDLYLHYVKANGVELRHTHTSKRLEARPLWRDTPHGTEVGVELYDLDGVKLAEQYRLLDA
jgi:hypothetical protein